MNPKSMFFCKTCSENRYGSVLQQATTYGQSLVIVYKCSSCDNSTIENLPTSYSVNQNTSKC